LGISKNPVIYSNHFLVPIFWSIDIEIVAILRTVKILHAYIYYYQSFVISQGSHQGIAVPFPIEFYETCYKSFMRPVITVARLMAIH
jgi:hypothetical protein